MRFSVVIPTCNRIDLLRKCLELLKAGNQSFSGEFEVIVTDDSLSGSARSLIENQFPGVKWIAGPRIGPAANRNNGVRSASGDWIVFIDDDCLPQVNWLASYDRSIIKNPDKLVFEGKTTADRIQKRFDETSPINLTGDKLWSCNFSIETSFFNHLKGFDEGFPNAAMEDVDFYSRVILEEKIIFVNEALVIHPWRQVKPFSSIRKHLNSHRFLLNKNPTCKNLNFRITRLKIFLSILFFDFFILTRFSMKGWKFYLELCIINFCMIFI